MEFHDKYFTKEELEKKFEILERDKTFGEIDAKDVFHKQTPAKGILGCVIEQSVLGMKQTHFRKQIWKFYKKMENIKLRN